MEFFYKRFNLNFVAVTMPRGFIFSMLFVLFSFVAYSNNHFLEKGIAEKNNLSEKILKENSVTQPDFFSDKKYFSPPNLSIDLSNYNGYNISCNGANDGAIDLTITGGLQPYQILWSTGDTIEDLSNLVAGTYSVTVIDANSDTAEANIELLQPDVVTITVDNIINDSCFGGNNGAIEISVSGGVASYNYLWSDGNTNEDITNLIAGNYTVTVTDLSGCSQSVSQTISEPEVIAISIDNVINDSCFGGNNGTIETSVSGGVGSYNYLWSDGNTNEDITNLIAGNYTVTATDLNGCSQSVSQSISQPDIIAISIDNIINDSCFGGNKGAIEISVSGGVGAYSYLWSDGNTNEDIANLIAGNYTVTVTDLNGCSQSVSQTISEPAEIQISFIPQTETCNNSNGSIGTNVTGGVQPYSYLWSDGSTNSALSAIPSGVYTVTVTDSNSCSRSFITFISNIPGPAATVNSITDVNCFGGSDGSIDIIVNSGTQPFSFLWSNGASTEDVSNITAGNYSVTVTDANSCSQTISQAITEPAEIQISFIPQNETCNNSNGSIGTNVTGGVQPYSYLWSDGSSNSTLSAISSGAYTITVTDNNSCSRSFITFISNIPGPSATVTSITDVNCFGGNDGSIDITVNSGTQPFSFLWSNGTSTEDVSNLTAGNYSVTVTDANSCSQTISQVITEPAEIQISFIPQNETCSNSNGSIGTNVTGGVQPYSYLWSDGSSASTLSAISSGAYTVTVTDSNSCSRSFITFISNIPGPVATVTSITDVNCFGGNDGSIDIMVNNGTQPFSFVWSNGASTEDISNLPLGSYTITITDNNLCTSSTGEIINQPDSLSISLNIIPASGGPNGSILTSVTGGTPLYSYLWSTGATTADISGLLPGIFDLTVTDAHGCSSNRSGNVTAAACSVVVDSVFDVSCNAGNDGSAFITVTGAIPPVVYLWSNLALTEDIGNLAANTYTVTISDLFGCLISTSAVVNEPDSLAIDFATQNETCGNINGSISANVSGGTNPYTYLWSTSATTSSISNLAAGTYTVTVTDNHSCTKTQSVSITNMTGPILSLDSIIDVRCFGEDNGSIFILVTGGTPTISYLWSNSTTTEDLSNSFAGTYTVTVTDGNGCTASLSGTISQPAQIIDVIVSFTSETCTASNGTATATPSGGTSPYTYLWSDAQTTQTATALVAGTYTVTVTDTHGCTLEKTTTILNFSGPSASIDSVHNVRCFGQSNGGIFISVSGGTAPITYLWSNSTTNQNLPNVGAGTYSVTVSDFNGCTAALSSAISEPAVLDATIATINSTCGNANGSASANPTGGISPYTFLWSNSQVNQTATNLIAGNYTVTVTDNNGCTVIKAATVSNTAGPTIIVDSVNNVHCFGESTGGVFISISGGTPSFSYLWSDASTNQNLQNVIAGTYTVTVTDFNNCTAVATITITESAQLNAPTNVIGATCGNANGTASVVPSGGSSPYTFLWSTSATTISISGLISGVYTVTVTDNNSCTKVAFANVNNINGPSINLDSIHNVRCFGLSNGAIYIHAANGTFPYSYLWSNTFAGEDLVNVTAGTYTITVTDDNSCTATLTQTITEPATLNATASNTNSTCSNSNGTATVTVSGGISPYSFLWNNSQTTQIITGLTAAPYTVTVTDANNCTNVQVTLVSNISGPGLALDSITNVKCFGQTNGAIYIDKSGGTIPFTYQWSSGITSDDLVNVAAGIYTVTITDDNGCTDTLTATVSEPVVLSATISSTNSTCGNANGSAIASPAGGTIPYFYLWSDAETTQTASNLPAGNYTVTVTDVNSCSIIKTILVSNTPGPTINIDSVRNVNCFSESNGAIFISISAGTLPFTYLWSNATTDQNLNNIPAGAYTVTVSDNNLCTSSTGELIDQPDSLSISLNIIPASGGPNGSILSSVTGGTPQYSYLWSTGATTNDVFGLLPGVFDLTVTDAHGCSSNRSGNVTAIACSVVIDSVIDVSCHGGSDGAIYISAINAIPPVIYLWSNLSLAEDLNGVTSGTYTVTVTDLFGCLISTSAVISEPNDITIGFVTQNETCGNGNGSATVNVDGGTNPYTYTWSTSATTASISNLAAGTYTVTITDNHSCTKTQSVTITNITGPVIALDSIVSVRCFGDSFGAIFIHVPNGTPPFAFLWSDASTNEDLTNVVAGNYSVIVTDSVGCTDTLSATITQPLQLNDSTTTTNTLCGNSNGTAKVWPYGGLGPYTYLWSPGGQTTQQISGLSAGSYTVTVTDANNCSITSVAIVNNTNGPTIITDSIFDVRCNGESNGSIFITPLGGTPPYLYFWSNGPNTQDNQNIPAGPYFLLVTDSNNCVGSKRDTVEQPDVLNDSIQKTNEICGQVNGTITVFAYGGTVPYTYLWSQGDTTQSIDSLAAGTYTVTITDNHSCTKVSSVTINNTPGPSVIIDSVKNVNCFDESNGSIYISVTGGTFPYSYEWSPGGFATDDIFNLSAGTYTVIVTDSNSCTVIDSATVTQPDSLTLITSSTPSTCGASNGTASVVVSGGTSPYTYKWSTGSVSPIITGLAPGPYTITVTDSHGCKDSAVVFVTSTGGPTIMLDSIVNVKCFGQDNGAIYITATGTPMLTYLWLPNGATTKDNIDVVAGIYIVLVFDGNNCITRDTFEVSQPQALDDSISIINETCGYGNGVLTANPFGGTPPYFYAWSASAQTTQSIDSLSAGTYTVTITDSNGCTKISSATIVNIAGPTVVVDLVDSVNCNGQNNGAIFISINGGAPSFTYEWSNSDTTQDINNLFAGNYTVIVTDSNNCKDTSSVIPVFEPNLLSDVINSISATCGNPNGSATVFPSGGTSPYSYLWSNAVTIATISNVDAGTYTVTITDKNNCQKIDSVNILNIPGPVINLDSVINVKCFGDSTGNIFITALNGTPSYDYLWSNADTTDDIFNLTAGIYTVTVSDSNSCTATASYTVNQPSSPLNDSISVTDAKCGRADGSLTANPFGGTGPYTYLWSTVTSDTTKTINNLFFGIYTVTVTDGNGCTIISSATVGNIPGPSVIVDSVYNEKCNGASEGAIFITPLGGTPGYTYLWSFNADTTQDIINLPAGTYTITVTDANLCTAIDSIIVAEPLALNDSIVVINATCGDSNGVATVYPYDGTASYSLVWSVNGQTTPTIDSLAAGTYTVTITDANGCTRIDNANISSIGGPILAVDSVKNVSCNGNCDGAVYILTSAGLPPYQFLWSNAETTEDITNLCADTYTLTVTDSIGCISIISQTVIEPDSFLLSVITTPASCNDSNGTATVNPSGGTAPYTYLWSNAQTTQTITNIPAGNYTVTVTDSLNCTAGTIAIVVNPNPPVITDSVVTNIKCFGGSEGGVDITVSGGTPGYTFTWSNTFPVDTAEDLQNVIAGIYTVTVTDAANCSAIQTFAINQPPDIQIFFDITDPSCNTANGSVITTVTGGTGTGTYNYLWDNSVTTSDLDSLIAGSYTLTVTDGNLCTKISIADLSDISAPTITVLDSGDVSCYGTSDGFINVSVSGGAEPYIYSWTNTAQSGPFINNLAGNLTYTLTLTDSNNCIAVRSVFINQPDSISIFSNVPLQNGIYNISCNGGNDGSIQIFPSGGTTPYTFLWSNANMSDSLINLIAITYTVTVTDARSCTQSATYTLTEPPPLISNAGSNFIICGVNSDTLHANVPAYGTGQWVVTSGAATIAFPDSATTPVTGLGVGNNVIQWIVSDNVCSDSSQVIITVNLTITAIAGANRIVCTDSVALTATPPQFGSGFWEVVNGGSSIIDVTQAQTSAIALSPGENKFKWTVTNGNCIDSAYVVITLRSPAECLEDIQLPNGITPNGDGMNDVLFIKGLGDYFEHSILVYNRWGNKVFEQSPYLNEWNGVNQKGEPLPEGTYFVIFKVKSIDKIFTGYIDVRR